MVGFRNGLILQSNTNKEFNLPETHSISCISSIFTIDPKKEYLYAVDEGIVSYTTNPLNIIKKSDYKKKIKCICASSQCLYILNDDSLVFYSKHGFNVISADFKDSKLQLIDKEMIGVQNMKELIVFDKTFRRNAVFRCQCSYSAKDILLIGFITTLKVYLKEALKFEVIMPAYITCTITDNLFTKIYCATQDNNIYCYDLTGKPLATMEYHTKPVQRLRLSFCGNFLYSSDGNRLCIWNTQHNVVIGYVDIEEGIEDFDTLLIDDFQYNLDTCIL